MRVIEEAVRGCSAAEKLGLYALIIITLAAIIIGGAMIIFTFRKEIALHITIKADRACDRLDRMAERIEQYSERNDSDLHACVEQWWDETKALKTQVPTIKQVLAYQLKGSIR